MLNVVLTLTIVILNIGLLAVASHSTFPVALAAALVFSFTNNTLFSLMHECVHRSFSKNRTVNHLFGVLASAFFPTGFSLQRVFHLGHHRRNRTDAEMFDYYYPGDIKLLKYLQWYGILIGVYWLSVPFAAIMYLIFPGLFQLRFLKREHQVGQQTGAHEMFAGLAKLKRPAFVRLEILCSLALQALLFWSLDLQFSRWLLCYWLFGMNWGALQYADHAWSVRDIRHGAWNLRTSKPMQWIFLNYHLHLAHHQHPKLGWRELPKYVDETLTRPTFLSVYLSMWRGPRPTTEAAPASLDEAFLRELEE